MSNDNQTPEENLQQEDVLSSEDAPTNEEIEQELLDGMDQAAQTDKQVIALQEQLATAKDQAVRAQAEVQNARRRAEQDVEKAHKFAVEKIVKDLLPVADNLERALATAGEADESAKAIVEGVELTLKSFTDTLAKHNVVAVDPEGEPFDPNLHQAMSMIPSPDVEPNTVLNVFQKGYTLNGRLVRPAMVVVSTSA